MNEITIQTRVLSKLEMVESAQKVADNLLEIHSGIESFVLVKNMICALEQTLELLKEGAISQANGKEEMILGAKVSVKNLPKKWEYVGTEYTRLFNNLEHAKSELKNHTKVLELSNWINPATGETESATLIPSDKTRTITVQF